MSSFLFDVHLFVATLYVDLAKTVSCAVYLYLRRKTYLKHCSVNSKTTKQQHKLKPLKWSCVESTLFLKQFQTKTPTLNIVLYIITKDTFRVSSYQLICNTNTLTFLFFMMVGLSCTPKFLSNKLN